MPYIAIKGYPKDQETKKRVVEKINKIFIDEWGCAPEAISISVEEIAPEDWNEKIREGEIKTKVDKMMIIDGKAQY